MESLWLVTMESAVFMGKNFQDNQNSIMNTTDLTLKQMFDISTRLVSEQNEISGMGNNWLSRKSHQSSAHEGLRLFGFCVVPWEDFRKS